MISTQKGLFRYNRLPFGVASAPAIFQQMIEGILRGILHVYVYIDDMLVMGKSEEQHLQTVDEVLSRLEAVGLRLEKELRALPKSKRQDLLRDIALPIEIPPDHSLAMKANLSISWSNLHTLRRCIGQNVYCQDT